MIAVLARALPVLVRRVSPTVGRTLISRLGGGAAKKYARKVIVTDAKVVSGGVLARVGRWLKKPGFVKDFVIWTGASAAIDAIFDDSEGDNADKVSQSDKLAVQQYLNSLADDKLGYADARALVTFSERDDVSTARLSHMASLIERNLFKKGRLAGKVSSNDLVMEFSDLTDAERLLLNNQLVGLAKMIAASSDYPETMLLASRQAMSSLNPSPVFSKGADVIFEGGFKRQYVENQAALMNHTYEGLVEELAQTSFDEAFDEGADIFWDFFDLVGSNEGNEMSEEVIVNMQLAHLVYRGAPTDFGDGIMAALREFATDSDGKDDESAILVSLQEINRIHPRMKSFINSISKGENNRADANLE